MKKYHAWVVYIALALASAQAAVVQQEVVSAFIETTRGPHQRTLSKTNSVTLPDGRVTNRVSSVVEMASGLHYWEEGQWKQSRDEIEITLNGAVATKGQHKVNFAGNINAVGAITLTTPDSKTLNSHVVGLAYTDSANGQSVLLGQVQNSEGLLYAPNRVVYPNAFEDVAADIRYIYTKRGFEQDVILRERPPSPANYNLNPETTALEVWTEFVNPPEPTKEMRSLGTITDETLNFGAMRMGRGSAFALGAPANRLSGAPVGKTWLKVENRTFLIESVPYQSIAAELAELPLPQAALRNEKNSRLALLQKSKVPAATVSLPVRMALDLKKFESGKGLVLDYVIITGETNDCIFQADTTYLMQEYADFLGTTTFEGGTIIKYNTTNDIQLQTWGPTIFKTDPYRPAIFTSRNDRTVGVDWWLTNSPTNYFCALSITQPNQEFKHLRISHATYGIHSYSQIVRDAQFTHCQHALFPEFGSTRVDNALFYNCSNVFYGQQYTASARHITVNECARLTDSSDSPGNNSVAITNSLLVNIVTNGLIAVTTNYTVTTTGTNVFQTVGAGAHYLADPSPYRDAGTTNIPATTAARLRRTTTYPPLLFPYGNYGASQTLFPRAGRDTDLPDLGYHYDPLDYAFNRVFLTNATFDVEPGTAIAAYNPSNTTLYGIRLGDGGRFISNGRAESKVTFTHYVTAQEMANSNWNGPIDTLVSFNAAGTQEFRCRFTDFSVLNQSPFLLSGGYTTWHLTDCQFHGGSLANTDQTVPMYVTNCLFNRNYSLLWPLDSVTNQFRNCTFYGGITYLYSPLGTATDCLFDGTASEFAYVGDIGDVAGSNNGYTTNYPLRLYTSNGSDVILTNLTFQTGTLGYFYIPSNALVNAGSRYASNATLFHYTMLTNNVKETNTIVDIGFHYVATDANGTPLDYDGDGVPDYWEDTNGNGSAELTEINWQDADTDNDGVPDGEEIIQGRNPLGGALADTNNIINLRVFTPLK